MPRPKTVEDDEIFRATAEVIGRVGPMKLTLARVAEECGLSPATLVQRFGSKRGLLVGLARHAQGDSSDFVDQLRRKHPSPVRALREYLLCFAGMASTPEEMANHLAALQMDLADPDLRQVALAVTRNNEKVVAALLEEALRAGELTDCRAKQLAPILLTVAQGALLSWALERKGTARKWLARHVDVALRPYLRAKKVSRDGRKRRR